MLVLLTQHGCNLLVDLFVRHVELVGQIAVHDVHRSLLWGTAPLVRLTLSGPEKRSSFFIQSQTFTHEPLVPQSGHVKNLP